MSKRLNNNKEKKPNYSAFRNNDRKSKAKDLEFRDNLVRIWYPEVSDQEKLALKNISKYPDVKPYIAVMPDFHLGQWTVNGSIIPSENLVYPNTIGGDIGCGISSLRIPVTYDEIKGPLREIYNNIYGEVPTGKRVNRTPNERVDQNTLFNQELEVLNNANIRNAKQQLGTLGRGNHFVELQKDDEGDINLMIHTGSRGLGQIIRNIFFKRSTEHPKAKACLYLEADSPEGENYLAHVNFAIDYAKENRKEIARKVIETISEHIPRLNIEDDSLLEGLIDTSHNTISREVIFGSPVFVHRKGAINIPEGVLAPIPGNMGSISYIVEGRGNKYSFDSASHGAGRAMSRGEAQRKIRKEDLEDATQGVICRKNESIVDEAPQAYKDIEKVMSYQKDLIKRRHAFYPITCVKG